MTEVTIPVDQIQEDNIELNVVGFDPLDPLIEISPDDAKLKQIVGDIRSKIKEPTLQSVVKAVYETYPQIPEAQQAIRDLRASDSEPIPLGNYFDPGEGYAYKAVCVHKALLSQAVASTYGITTQIVDFGFMGQIKDFEDNGEAGMHSALKETDQEGKVWIGDSHKGIYEEYDDYWKRFTNPQIFLEDTVVFAPNLVNKA